MGLVGIAGAATMLVAVLLIAEPTFHAHLTESSHPCPNRPTPASTRPSTVWGIALAVGVVVALAVALFVTWLVPGRLAASVAEASGAADWIADGDYQTRLQQPGLGPEFDQLTTSFDPWPAGWRPPSRPGAHAGRTDLQDAAPSLQTVGYTSSSRVGYRSEKLLDDQRPLNR